MVGTTNQEAMIAAKNLSILEDQLSSEALAAKKMALYANYCNDQQLKAICQRAADMHKQHYGKLLSYLESHNKPKQ